MKAPMNNCNSECFRADGARRVAALLEQCELDEPRYATLSGLLGRLWAAPCFIYCDRGDRLARLATNEEALCR